MTKQNGVVSVPSIADLHCPSVIFMFIIFTSTFIPLHDSIIFSSTSVSLQYFLGQLLHSKELLTFAGKIRTNLDDALINDRVERILTRLGL